MLDFPEKIYAKIVDLAIKHNFIAYGGEYPFLRLEKQPLPFSMLRRRLQENFRKKGSPWGLYIHFPFCRSRCLFCKYYSQAQASPQLIEAYLNTLCLELRSYGFSRGNWPLKHIYLGGGTPTLMNEEQIGMLQKIIRRFFCLDRNGQVTIEGTPDTLKKMSILEKWRDFGVNRISVGCQSFNDDILRRTGRLHSVKDIFKAAEMIKKASIKYLAIDLLLGLPGETTQSYKRTIAQTIKLSPDYIECYLLTGGGRAKIGRQEMDDKELDRFIRFLEEKFVANNYRIYFLGNVLGFVKKGVPASGAVNQMTDKVHHQLVSCLGIGAGAISQFADLKYHVFSDYSTYIKRLKDNSPALYYGRQMSLDDRKRQYIIMRIAYFRFLNKKDYFRLFHSRPEDDFRDILENLKKDKKVLTETRNKIIWHLDERAMDHQGFFLHVLKYWYDPKYIVQLIKRYFND